MAYDGLKKTRTITIISAPSENDAWSILINIPRVDCLRGYWKSFHVKDFIAGGYFAAQ